MSFFSRIFSARQSESYHPSNNALSTLIGGVSTDSGESVDESRAITYSAVWAATRLLTETIASLPLILYKRGKDESRARAVNHPVFDLTAIAPNAETETMAFRETMLERQINCGNAYAEIERDPGTDTPLALWPIASQRVRVCRDQSTGEMFYRVDSDKDTEIDIPARDMVHIRGILPSGGIVGKGVVTYARESIGSALATEKHGASFFRNNAVPPAVVLQKKKMLPESRADFRREWKEIHGGADNAGEIAVLTEGADIKQLSFSNEDSQYLETRQHNVQEIARWYRVPPHFLGDLSRATFSNIEQQALEFLTYSLRRWFVSWEQQLARKLLNERERRKYYYEHLIEALLRADIQARYNAYSTGRQWGWLSANDVLRKENENGIGDAGDIYLTPSNMINAEDLLKEEEPENVLPLPPTQRPGDPPGDEDGGDTGLPVDEAKEQSGAESKGDGRIGAMEGRLCALVQATMSRLMTKETQAVVRASARPHNFLSWMDGFYERHRGVMLDALAPVVDLWVCAAGKDPSEEDALAVVLSHIDQSKEELLELSGQHNADRFQQAVEARMRLWRKERGVIMSEKVLCLRGESCCVA